MLSDLGDRIWFTADNHFGHENIIGFCNRPFASAREMDEAMIERWNRVVKPGDVVYHLGDFTLGGAAEAVRYFRQLNGRIYVLGNDWHHDKRWLPRHTSSSGAVDLLSFFNELHQLGNKLRILPPMYVLEIKELGKDGRPLPIVLCHYPLAEWDRQHYGSWHLHGHSHGNHKYTNGEYAIDVGVDSWNFTPLSLGGVLEIMYSYGWM
jgi:calcineurin-like phosphoesterase family protein